MGASRLYVPIFVPSAVLYFEVSPAARRTMSVGCLLQGDAIADAAISLWKLPWHCAQKKLIVSVFV
jgi:hypothetical protein